MARTIYDTPEGIDQYTAARDAVKAGCDSLIFDQTIYEVRIELRPLAKVTDLEENEAGQVA